MPTNGFLYYIFLPCCVLGKLPRFRPVSGTFRPSFLLSIKQCVRLSVLLFWLFYLNILLFLFTVITVVFYLIKFSMSVSKGETVIA